MMPAMLNRRLHGSLVTGTDMMPWATSDSTDYIAADTCHYCSRSAECWLLPHWCGHYRYTCSHGLDAVVWHISRTSSIHLGFCGAMPSPWQWQPAGWGRYGTMHTPSLHIPLLCPTLYPIPAWAHWLDRRSACWRDWSYLIVGLGTEVARWCM